MSKLNIFSHSKEEEQPVQQQKSYGMAKKSAATAKPAREKAGTVRKGNLYQEKAPVQMTREEKKAARAQANAEYDRINAVSQILLNENPDYINRRKKWWIAIIFGLLMTGISWAAMSINKQTPSQAQSLISIVSLALAYAAIFGALIFDMKKIKPIRTEAQEKAKGYSERRQEEMIRAADIKKKNKKKNK